MLSRRSFIEYFGKTCLALGLGSLFPLSAEAANPPGFHTPAEGRKGLYTAEFICQLITHQAESSRIIMWQTRKQMEAPGLEYRAKDTVEALWGEVSYDYLEQEGRGIFLYACHLTGLPPENLCQFRIVDGNRATEWEDILPVHFNAFQMLIFADSQSVDYGAWQRLADSATRRHPRAELATVIGDLTDNGQSYEHWQGWYRGAANLLRSHIFVPVMGNHECYDLKWQMCLPEGYLHHFIQPDNGSSRFPGYYYSFDYGPVHFIVLNNQFDELDNLKPGLREEELLWLRRDVKQSRCPWRIVLLHKDIIHYEFPSPEKGAVYINDLGDTFMPVFEECSIDLVLTGHLHVYRNRGHLWKGKPSGHGPVYVLCGPAGDQYYPEVPISPLFDQVSLPSQKEDTYLTLDASAAKLRLQCHLTDGTVIDDMELKK